MPLINAQTNPTADQFYVVPDDVSKYNLGEIIGNNRTVDTVIDPSNLKRAYQILYRTNSKGNIPDATVATVFVPAKPKKPAKLFSYQAPEDATVLDCATSYALLKDTSSNNSGLQPLAKQVIEYALSRGYYVVAPDAEGSQSAWLVGATEGQACLDAINATIRGLQLPAKTPVALFGYSGGAHTTVWASSLAAKYAPNLNIVGASYGGTPIDLRACFYKLNATPLALIAGGALFGLANGIPALRSYLVSEFNDIGRSDDKKFHDPGFCISKFIYAGFLSNDYLKDFNDPILARGTPASTIVDDESLLSNVSSKTIPVPKFPRLQYHSREDNVIPFDPAQAYVSQQCNTTTNLRLAFAAYPAGDHITTGNNVTYPLAFLRDALEGNLTTITCGQPY
ncbi:LIP-domain-containing protein [Dissoconium aciculare CBS 342.82]|uniref:LIP-domain-containing protein n=1 Tax=Dissoconium aciculare CBS 342.82 TaxID=1314786 RepID=A0A6J3LXA6_9PEZI|nr:LIP-domain-containing protein [Dissoconium aciculare CBS 342.82]KAF1819272.1 LIP-domain-containing protein [Dissoconium aciculare CBS 342.82]